VKLPAHRVDSLNSTAPLAQEMFAGAEPYLCSGLSPREGVAITKHISQCRRHHVVTGWIPKPDSEDGGELANKWGVP